MNKIRKLISDLEFLWQFSLDDFRRKYAGSVVGIAWAVFQPLSTVILYWFVFQFGLRTGSDTGVPFILWLIAGLLPWLYISDTLAGSMPALAEYSYLVKKVQFNIDILPLIKIISGFLIHLILIAVMVLMYLCYGFLPDIFYLQVFFYMAYSIVLLAGLVYLTCTLFVFFKDIIQIVSILLQAFFWTTPIVWSLDIMSPGIQMILKLNPFFYMVRGYRDCLVNKVWFWEHGAMNLYYWIFAFGLLYFGVRTFKKCKRHFADVL